MSAPLRLVADAASPRRRLRVRVDGGSSEWARQWQRRLAARGHLPVDDNGACDVVLADRAPRREDAALTVVVGNVTFAGSPSAAGMLDASASDEQVDAALHAVASGLVVQSRTADPAFTAAHEGPLAAILSPREAEVLSAIANGDSNKMIARRLAISLHTVKFHVESVFRKLGARSRAEAVARAVEYRRRETIEL